MMALRTSARVEHQLFTKLPKERNMRRLMNQVQKYERHEISFYRGLEYNYGANWSTVLLCIL